MNLLFLLIGCITGYVVHGAVEKRRAEFQVATGGAASLIAENSFGMRNSSNWDDDSYGTEPEFDPEAQEYAID